MFEYKFIPVGKNIRHVDICILILSSQVAQELVESVHGTGNVCISLVKAASAVSGSPEDQSLKRALMDQARIVAEKVSYCYAVSLHFSFK